MCSHFVSTIFLPDEDATTCLGKELASVLKPGDVILLKGSVGAGKSHLARAIIQARLGYDEEVPSPTYTLIQTYTDASSEILHADLYRLGDASELAELGLEEAFENAICLVEWADRLGKDDTPDDALSLVITNRENGREAVLTSNDARWTKLERPIERTRFLIGTDFCGAARSDVAGDLSSRTYQRLYGGDKTAILMDAGSDSASTEKFVQITDWLRQSGYSAPEVYAKQTEKALLLLEDFGDQRLSGRADAEEKMGLCLSLLADIRTRTPPPLPCPDALELAEMTKLAEHYPGADAGALDAFRVSLLSVLEDVITNIKPTVSLRDFHADNIMWLADRSGIKSLGLLDYQDAFLTHPVYDLVSLLTDARRDVSRQVRAVLIGEYALKTGDDIDALRASFAVFSIQRNLRILGIFARAAVLYDKTHHVKNLPRVYGYLAEALEHPIFDGSNLLAALPEPDGALLARLTK